MENVAVRDYINEILGEIACKSILGLIRYSEIQIIAVEDKRCYN